MTVVERMGAGEAYMAVTEMCNIKHVLVGILHVLVGILPVLVGILHVLVGILPTPGIEF